MKNPNYQEDHKHRSGDWGTFILAVRKSIATALAGTDGDYSPLITDDDGKLWVRAGDTVTIHGRTSQYMVGGFSDTQSVHFDVTGIITTTAYMLVDISNVAVWKHTNTDHIIIDHFLIEVDPNTQFTGEIKIGFLTNVDGDNGDFNQILDVDLAQKSDLIVEDLEFGSHGLHCQASTHFGPIIVNSTLFQTDVDLGGPDDPATLTYPSGDGDLAMIIERSAGTVDVSITMIYETVSP